MREQLLSLMEQTISRGMPVLMLASLQMSDYLRETRSPPHELRKSILGGEEDLLNHIFRIFRAAAQRGEIDKRKLTPRAIRLVPDLVRHELLMTLKLVSRKALSAHTGDCRIFRQRVARAGSL